MQRLIWTHCLLNNRTGQADLCTEMMYSLFYRLVWGPLPLGTSLSLQTAIHLLWPQGLTNSRHISNKHNLRNLNTELACVYPPTPPGEGRLQITGDNVVPRNLFVCINILIYLSRWRRQVINRVCDLFTDYSRVSHGGLDSITSTELDFDIQ